MATNENTIITPTLVARETLMLLKGNTVMPQLVSRDFEDEFREEGDTVMVRRPANFEAKAFDPATGIEIQNVVEGKVPVTLDTILDVSFGISNKELTLSIQDFSRQLIAPAVAALQQEVDARLCGLYKDIPYYVGTPGQTPSSVAAVTAIRRAMNDNKAPLENRICVLDTSADARLLELDAFASAGYTGTADAITNARLGRKFGFDFYFDQSIQKHDNGTLGGTMKLAAKTLKGATEMTFAGATGEVKAGTIFTLAGDTRPYVITKDAKAQGNLTVEVYPAARKEYAQDVAATPIANHVASLAFVPQAFALVTRPLARPMGTAPESYAVVSDGGLSVRVVFAYDAIHKRDICSIDMLCGCKTMMPELAVRVLG